MLQARGSKEFWDKRTHRKQMDLAGSAFSGFVAMAAVLTALAVLPWPREPPLVDFKVCGAIMDDAEGLAHVPVSPAAGYTDDDGTDESDTS